MTVGTGFGVLLVYLPFMLFALYCGSRWVKWAKSGLTFSSPKWRSWLALLGFVAGNVSFLFSLGLVIYAHLKMGLPNYHPVLLTVLRSGFWLSLAGWFLAVAGKGHLRLPAWGSNSLMLGFWVMLGLLQ